MKRIIVIGNSGSGKTTFSKVLAEKTRLPLVHLDKIYWKGNWEHLTREEFVEIIQKELEKPEWIIDGNFNKTIPHRLKYCDTVFYFDLPTITCLWSVTKRILKNRGKVRDDMGGNCIEHFDKQKKSLYRNIITFNKQHRNDYYEMLNGTKNINIIVFKSRRQVKRYLQRL